MNTLTWPVERVGLALEALGRAAGLSTPSGSELAAPGWLGDAEDQTLGQWIEAAATSFDMEAESSELNHAGVPRLVRSGGPVLIRVFGRDGDQFLALLGRRGNRVRFVAPDRSVCSVSLTEAVRMLRDPIETPLMGDVDRLLDDIGLQGAKRERARRAVLDERLAAEAIASVWFLRLPPGASFTRQLARAGSIRQVWTMALAHTAQYLLFIASWAVVGRAALEGSLDRGWLVAWGLLLLTVVPLRALLTWSQGMFAVGAGGLLKQRLLFGATRLSPEEVRHEGAGKMLGRVIESEAVESLALSGGVFALMAGIEMVMAAAVLALGAGGALHVVALVAWLGLTAWLAMRYLRHRRGWTGSRMHLTNDLVERLVGHRTRLAQEPRERWHEGEDQSLENYVGEARAMDRSGALLATLVPRGWLLIGLLGLAPVLIAGSADMMSIAVALGGLLLAHQAFEKLVAGLSELADARIAWQQVDPLFQAAKRPDARGEPAYACGAAPSDDAEANGTPIIDASDLTFKHDGRAEPVLRGLHLRIDPGERLLLEGPSGCGKSTLASLLTGLRSPDSGLILLDGLDRQTLGADGWRRRVAAAPQFHENHVLTGTFAFNLLMGRRWPAPPEDVEEAEDVCRELGLGGLIDRMPAGMLQMVGESGWQLSHGEKSRMFMARALLQGAELVVLDESFAALDPETLGESLRCAVDRAPTLLVIAHP